MLRNTVPYLLSFFILFLTLSILYPFAPDDAYIHLRIGSHWAAGLGPFFDPSHAVLASSSVLWSALLSLSYLVLVNDTFPWGIVIANSIFGACSIVLLRELTPRTPWLPRLLSYGIIFCACLTFMETALTVTLLLLSFLLSVRGYSKLSTAVLSITSLLRLEVLVFLGVHVVFEYLRTKSFSNLFRQLGLSVLCFVIPYCSFTLLIFSDLLPHSIQAKSIIYHLSFEEALLRLLHGVLLGTLLGREQVLLASFGLLLFFSLLILIFQLPRERVFWAKVVYAHRNIWIFQSCALACLYLLSGTLLFPWYFPVLLIPVVVGLLRGWEMRGAISKLAILLLLCPSGLYLFQALYSAGSGNFSLYPGNPYDARSIELRAVGAFAQKLQEKNDNITRILAPEIGGLGYEWQGEIVDGAGLSRSDVLALIKKASAAGASSQARISRSMINVFEPNLAVGFKILFDPELLSDLPQGWKATIIDPFPAQCRRLMQRGESFPFGPLIVLTKEPVSFSRREYEAFRSDYYQALVPSCANA